MLYAPPREPVPLDGSQEVVLGRSRDCDLPLPTAQASRRHAQVRCEGERFVVEDLGSTNGTAVNGVALTAPRPLSHGDRIEIGDVTVTYCEVDAAKPDEAPEGGTTMLFQAPTTDAVDALRGDLDEIPAFAVLQMLEMGAKTGRLSIDGPSGPAQLWLREGRPVHAEWSGEQGLEAALGIAGVTAGQFLFAASPDAPAETIQATLTEILLEATRRSDESSR